MAAEYVVSTPTTVTNGGVGNPDGNDSFTVTSTGSIATTIFGTSIAANGNMNIISNAGTVSASSPLSYGIYQLGDNNNIFNTGTINAPFGINVDGIGNKIDNSGVITVIGSGAGGAGIFALSTVGTVGNIVNNSGTINSAVNNSAGIFVNSPATAGKNIVNNSGVIRLTGGNNKAIYVVGENEINNIGEIYALGANSNVFETDNSSWGTIFTNSGKLISIEGKAVLFGASDSQLSLLAPSFIAGAIDMGAFNNVLDITSGRSQSNSWFITGTPIAVNRLGLLPSAWTGIQYATIDPTALSASANLVADLTSGVSEIVRNNSEGGEWWLKSFGSYSEYGASGIYNDYADFNAGIVGGASTQINADFYVGAMLGYGISNLSVNSKWEISQTINSKGVLGALYAKSQFDNFYADFSIFGGLMGNDSSRLVNDNTEFMGIDHAIANYNSWFITPELRIGADIATDSEWAISPRAMIRYTSQAIDGYIETGSNANATIGARTVQVLEGNVELAASTALENGTLTLASGIDYRQAIGENQAVTLLGQNITLAQNTANTTIGYVSADVSYELGGGANLDLSARAAFGTNNHKSIAGSVGISGKF